MRIPLTVTIIAIAMLASPLAYGQAALSKGQIGTQGTSAKPSGPAVGGGDRTLIPPTQPAVAPPSSALSNLAGGGYADPNYVPPGTQSKKTTRHRVIRASRPRTPRRFEQHSVNPASILLLRLLALLGAIERIPDDRHRHWAQHAAGDAAVVLYLRRNRFRHGLGPPCCRQ
jgi:hypothetical protein